MKSFPAAYKAELARTDGATPYWVLKITCGAASYYISDNQRTISAWSVTAYAAIKSLDAFQEGTSGAFDEYHVAEMTATLFADVSLGSTTLRALAMAGSLDTADVRLYLGLAGISDAPQQMNRFRVRDLGDMDDTTLDLDLQDLTYYLEKHYTGTKVATSDYPNAYSEDVGLVIPRIFNTVTKAPARCLKATAPYVYCYSDKPVDSAPHVYAKNSSIADIDITSYCTIYTGQSGSELTGYEDLGVISITADQAAQIQNLVQASIDEGNHTHSTGSGNGTIYMDTETDLSSSWSTDQPLSNAADSDVDTYAAPASGNWAEARLTHTGTISESGTPTAFRILFFAAGNELYGGWAKVVHYTGGSWQVVETVQLGYSSAKTGYYTGWHSISSWSELESDWGLHVHVVNTSNEAIGKIYEAWFDVTLNDTVNSSAATGVAIISPDPENDVSEMILVNCTRTLTNAAIFDEILSEAGISDSVSIFSGVISYTLQGAIVDYATAISILNKMAFQLTGRFAMVNGLPKVLARVAASSSVKTISNCLLDDNDKRRMKISRTDYDEIINYIDLLYNRDWTTSGDDAYQSNYKDDDATSVAAFGTHESTDNFKCDFVGSSTHAAAVVAFYLANYKDRHWQVEFYRHLADMDIELGDTLTLVFLDNASALVCPAEPAPGDYSTADLIKITARI